MKTCPNGHENEDWRTTCKSCYLALEEVEPPAPPPAHEPATPPPPPPPPPAPAPAIELIPLRVTVAPGSQASCDVRVGNVGSADDTIALQVEGELSAWALPEPQSVALGPGAERTAQVVLRLPASATVTPGEHQLELRATSGRSGASAVATATVVVPGTPAPPPKDDHRQPRPAWQRSVAAVAAVLVLAVVVVVLAATGDGELENTVRPSIDGTPRVLEVLTADPGEWTADELEFAFQWQRCDPTGSCGEIEGAVLPSYQAGSGDEGLRLQVDVTAVAGDRQATAGSDPTAAIEPVPPIDIAMPSVVGFERSDAIAALQPNFQVVTTTAGPQSESCDPVVESQAPAPGSLVPQGQQVVITTRPAPPFHQCLIVLPPLFELPTLLPDEPDIQFFEEEVLGS